VWGKAGYRPVLRDVQSEFTSTFPAPEKLFTIEDLGGWTAVDKQFFDRDNGMLSHDPARAGSGSGWQSLSHALSHRPVAAVTNSAWQTPLKLGLTSAYLSLVVLIPIAALIGQATGAWRQGAWAALTNPQTLAALS